MSFEEVPSHFLKRLYFSFSCSMTTASQQEVRNTHSGVIVAPINTAVNITSQINTLQKKVRN